MVSCQGCGNETDSTLTCPICDSFGRKSIFCKKKCFDNSWISHNALHHLMERSVFANENRSHNTDSSNMQYYLHTNNANIYFDCKQNDINYVCNSMVKDTVDNNGNDQNRTANSNDHSNFVKKHSTNSNNMTIMNSMSQGDIPKATLNNWEFINNFNSTSNEKASFNRYVGDIPVVISENDDCNKNNCYSSSLVPECSSAKEHVRFGGQYEVKILDCNGDTNEKFEKNSWHKRPSNMIVEMVSFDQHNKYSGCNKVYNDMESDINSNCHPVQKYDKKQAILIKFLTYLIVVPVKFIRRNIWRHIFPRRRQKFYLKESVLKFKAMIITRALFQVKILRCILFVFCFFWVLFLLKVYYEYESLNAIYDVNSNLSGEIPTTEQALLGTYDDIITINTLTMENTAILKEIKFFLENPGNSLSNNYNTSFTHKRSENLQNNDTYFLDEVVNNLSIPIVENKNLDMRIQDFTNDRYQNANTSNGRKITEHLDNHVNDSNGYHKGTDEISIFSHILRNSKNDSGSMSIGIYSIPRNITNITTDVSYDEHVKTTGSEVVESSSNNSERISTNMKHVAEVNGNLNETYATSAFLDASPKKKIQYIFKGKSRPTSSLNSDNSIVN